MRDASEGNERNTVMSGRAGACAGSGGVSDRDCCRLLEVILELWEDLPYSFPFFFKLFLVRLSLWSVLQKKKVTGLVILWGGRGKSETNDESLLSNKCETWIVMNKLCSVG